MGEELTAADMRRKMARTQDVLQGIEDLASVTKDFSESNKQLANEVHCLGERFHEVDKRVALTEQKQEVHETRLNSHRDKIDIVQKEQEKTKSKVTILSIVSGVISGSGGGWLSKFFGG